MSASTKLSTAVQALCYLSQNTDVAQSSDQISRATGIHAARLRKILSMLARDGIVTATRGLSGGFRMAKSPACIHLQEVYCAVETKKAFHLDVSTAGEQNAGLSRHVNGFFLQLFADLQVEIEDRMRTITLQDVLVHVEPSSTSTSSLPRG